MVDDNELLQLGKLPENPKDDCEPMEPEGQEQQPDATEDLDKQAPTMADLYGLDDLNRDLNRELVSLATLPEWPNGPAHGHGWGGQLDEVLGGGICPGYMLALGASYAGAGKTAWVMQIADGLALRCVEPATPGKDPGPLTPVIILSEMSPPALTWRTLARWTGHDSRVFRAGKSACNVGGYDKEERVNKAFEAAKQALSDTANSPSLSKARRFIRVLDPSENPTGPDLILRLGTVIQEWKDHLKTKDREVWPIVVVDPIQRWQDPAKGEVEALNELVELLGARAQEDDWIVFMTSDTTKAGATATKPEGNAKDRQRQEGTAVFRGSYKLLHMVDAALYMTKGDGGDDELELWVVKNRWGSSVSNENATVRYKWDVKTGRFGAKPLKTEAPRRNKRANK